MAVLNLPLTLLVALSAPVRAYLDHGDATLPRETIHTTTIPHHLAPTDQAVHLAGTGLITAIAPSISLLPNGDFETYYSMHFQNQMPRKKMGKGIFQRGVFASDPPFPTCEFCDANGNAISMATSVSFTGSAGGPSCTIIPYEGVFRSPDPAQTTYCFDTGYTGVFSTSVTYTYILPCCPSCAPNNTNSTSRLITTGVLASTTQFTSNGTVSTFRATSSTLPSSLFTTPSPQNPSMTPTPRGSSIAESPVIKPPGASLSFSSTPSIVVISSTTITVSANTSGGKQNTVTVITVTPSPSPSPSTTAPPASFEVDQPDTVIGCGTAIGGCGTVVGSGTVYLDAMNIMKVTSSGTAMGCAPKIIGCGTMFASTGTFTGSATVVGCGTASGTATLTGAGTVWPAIGGGLISKVSSGVVSGSGSVVGCGTIIGSGVFIATKPFSVLLPPLTVSSRLTPTKTVEVYVSYCPTTNPLPGMDLARFSPNLSSALNGSAPYPLLNTTLVNTTYPFLNLTSNYTEPANDVIPACKQCPESALCCAPNAECDPDGKCPHWAIEAMGYWWLGANSVAQRNLSDGTQAPMVAEEELREGIAEMGAPGTGANVGDGVLEGMTGGKLEVVTGGAVGGTSGRSYNGSGGVIVTDDQMGNKTSAFNGFVVKDDNVFFSHH